MLYVLYSIHAEKGNEILMIEGSRFEVQGSTGSTGSEGSTGAGGGFAEILRLRSQLFWHSLPHIRRFLPLRMTKRGDARRSADSRFPVWIFQTSTAEPRMTKISRFARNDDTKVSQSPSLLVTSH